MKNNMNAASNGKKDNFTHKVGDAVERLGEKVSNAGAEKIGEKIYKTGNKIEHSQDSKKVRP